MNGAPAGEASGDTVADHLAAARRELQAAYALIRNDVERPVPADVVLEQVLTCQELVDLTHAVQTRRLAEHAGTLTERHDPLRCLDCDDSSCPACTGTADGHPLAGRARRGRVSAAEEVDPIRAADLTGLLGWGPVTAARRLRDAVTGCEELPVLVDVLADGQIDRERLAAVAEALHDLAPERRGLVAREVEAAMLNGPRGGITHWTPTATRARVRAAVAQATDEQMHQRARRRAIRDALGVRITPGRIPGTSDLTATLTTEQAATIKAAIEKLAWAYRTQHTGDTLASASDAPPTSDAPAAASSGATGGCGASSASRGDGAVTRSGSTASRGGGAATRSGGAASRGGSAASRGGSAASRGDDAASRGDDAATRSGSAVRRGDGEPTLGECRAQALVDLINAQAQVSAQAMFLVPVLTPAQARVTEAAAGIADLLQAPGTHLSVVHGEGMDQAEFLAWLSDHPPPPLPDLPEEWFEQLHQESCERLRATGHADQILHPTPTDAPARPDAPSLDPPAALFPDEQPWHPPEEEVTGVTRDQQAVTELIERLDQLTAGGVMVPPAVSGDTGGSASPTAPSAASVVADTLGDVVIDGVGVIAAETVTGLIGSLGGTIGRALVDPITGTLREVTTGAYRPPRAMKDLIELRDLTCRFPGCTRPAAYTDIDHVRPYDAGGATTPANLACLCRTHHRAKQSGAWTLSSSEDGALTWTSYSGRSVDTTPAHEPIPF